MPLLPEHAPPDFVREQVPLALHTNLGVGGPARFFAQPRGPAQLLQALAWARASGLPTFVLGGGSNVVVSDAGFTGCVLCLPPAAPPTWAQAAQQESLDGRAGSTVLLRLPATCAWDAFCRQSVAWGLQGMECLVGIPGTLGASLLQNVGAYGQQLADVLEAVEVVHRATGARSTLLAAACGFGYRTSFFKEAWRGQYVVEALHLRLTRRTHLVAWPKHAGLAQALGAQAAAAAGPLPSVAATAAAVLALRRQKSMLVDPQDPNSRSVGSFFMNPVVSCAQAQALQQRFPSLQAYPAGATGAKLSAAALIEAAGLPRGHVFAQAQNQVGLSAHHALALVNLGGATAQQVVAAARQVHQQVQDQCGVALVAEPHFIGFATATPYLA